MIRLTFYITFLLMFLVGGFLNYFGILHYKMIMGVALTVFILPALRFKVNAFLLWLVAFMLVIIISAFVNGTSFLLTIWFFQNAAIPFLMYYLTVNFLSEQTITKVYKWVVLIACIQLPIIVLQRILYPFITKFAAVAVSDYDIGFGTFYTSDDIALSFFVIGTILFLLFDTNHHHIINNRMLIVIWLTLTILVLNSKISYLIVGLAWAYYLVTKVKLKVILTFAGVAIVIIALVYLFRYTSQIQANVDAIKAQLAFSMKYEHAEVYYTGAHGNRTAAVLHLTQEHLKIVGEGPHSLYNPITNKFNKGGDTSQLIGFYVDIGLIGLLLSYFIPYSIIRQIPGQFSKLYFLVLCLITAVSNVFLDASIMMIFVIFACSHLIPDKIPPGNKD